MTGGQPQVVTTRDRPGRLDSLLSAAGIDVVHVPLIEIQPGDNPSLAAALDRLDEFEWVVVTSVHGADVVAPRAAESPRLKLAAVGTATAARLAELVGRVVDRVPTRQTGVDLVSRFGPSSRNERVLVAQADRADRVVVDGLASLGYDVTPVVAYRTSLRIPSADERTRMLGADAVAFASGSAVVAWADSIGTETPPIVAAIGPTTAEVAATRGLQVTHIAADHSVEGLASTIITALGTLPPTRHRQPVTGDTSPLSGRGRR